MARKSAKQAKHPARNEITERILALGEERGMSGNELADKAGLSTSTIHAAKRRGSSLSIDNVVAIAGALDVSVDHIAGASPHNTGVSFQELVRWAFATPGVAQALAIEPSLSVGDLLRYRETPSKEGELNAEAVLAQIRALRVTDLGGGRDVTEEEAAKVVRMPPKRRPR